MIICGSTFLGADYSFSPTPTGVDNINSVTLQNGQFDTLAITQNTDAEKNYTLNTTWDNYTIMISLYDENLSAGNIDYALGSISDIVIKRREKGTFHWITIYQKEIHSLQDFAISFIDKYCKANTVYEYAYVGVLNGVEGNYNIKEVTSKFDGIVVCDKNRLYWTALDIGSCDTTRTHYLTKRELPMNKYPGSYSFSKTNYDTGEASGFFVSYDENACNFYPEKSFDYRKDITTFLTDHKPKILKHEDGRIWLISVDGNPTDSVDNNYLHRIISFSWYESGDYNSEKDLYDSGLSNVSQAFWSNP